MVFDISPLLHTLHRSFARFLRVTPQGLVFPDGRIRPELQVRIHHAHPTRTLYRNRKPVCRSLDGYTPLNRTRAEHCAECQARDGCVAQMNLQLTADGAPYNVLLSFSSLKNFLEFRARLQRPLERADISLRVLDRGHWGELTFREVEVKPA
jgi:hypothetical protein